MPEPANQRVHAFTLKADGIANCLHTPLEFAVPTKKTPYEEVEKTSVRGIWDTGATNTVITQKVVDDLKLKPTGQTLVNTASATDLKVNTYLVDIYLKKDLRVMGVPVTIGQIGEGIDCLIGMDIINLGDFSITNYNKKTCLSFRLPSLHEIDYLAALKKEYPASSEKVGRNDPCPCGSGKKFKRCCIKN